MSHVMNDDLFEVSINAVDHALIPDAYAIQVFRASQLDGLTRNRLSLQRFDLFEDARRLAAVTNAGLSQQAA